MTTRARRVSAMAAAIVGSALGLSACLAVPPPGGGGGTTTTTAPSVTTTSVATTSTTIAAGAPIGPEQHFVGLVNGVDGSTATAKPVISVVCPGPATAGRTGPPVSGQTVAVHQVASGGGDTGSLAPALWAVFPNDLLHVVGFSTYDTPGTVPTTLQLPCEGTGTVTFTACFGPVACAADAVDFTLTVTFVNIAA